MKILTEINKALVEFGFEYKSLDEKQNPDDQVHRSPVRKGLHDLELFGIAFSENVARLHIGFTYGETKYFHWAEFPYDENASQILSKIRTELSQAFHVVS